MSTFEWMDWARVVNNLQVDITSFCNARCGACVRNVDGDMVKPEIPMEHFDMDVWNRLVIDDTRGWFIIELTLNGNWGDPMMHPNLVEMLQTYCRYHPETALYIHTNGSMRTKKFWNKLGQVCRMFSNHAVVFAVDGLEDTHSIYRRKTDFNKIIENINAFVSGGGRAKVVMTCFEHNKHQVKDVEKIAFESGCIGFNLRHTHGDNLEIKTVDGDYKIHGHYDIDEYDVLWEDRNDKPLSDLRDYHDYTDVIDDKLENKVDHKCPWYTDRKIQIDPWATVWPCCHTSLYGIDVVNHDLDLMVNEDSFMRARNDNSLKNQSLPDLLAGGWWRSDLNDAIEHAEWKQCRDICGICK